MCNVYIIFAYWNGTKSISSSYCAMINIGMAQNRFLSYCPIIKCVVINSYKYPTITLL